MFLQKVSLKKKEQGGQRPEGAYNEAEEEREEEGEGEEEREGRLETK